MIRITDPPVDWDHSLSEFLSEEGKYLAMFEVGSKTNKPHLHIVCFTNKKQNTFRHALKKHLYWLEGNGSYSMKVVTDLEGALRYICKDGQVASQHGFFDKSPEKYRQEYYSCQEEFLKEKKIEREKKKWFESLAQECRAEGLEYEKDKFKILKKVYASCPTPTDYLVINYMRKLERVLDENEGVQNQWYRIQEKL